MPKEYEIEASIVSLDRGDITNYGVEAIVCPANPMLIMGNLGTSGAIKRAAGRIVQTSVDTYLSLDPQPGETYITPAGNISVDYIFHAICTNRDEQQTTREGFYSTPEMVQQATAATLDLARINKIDSIGFTAIGSGMGGLRLEQSVELLAREFQKHLREDTSLKTIGLVLYDPKAYAAAERVADSVFSS